MGRLHLRPGGGGETPYNGLNGLYGEASPESGTFFRLQVYEREGISLIDKSLWKSRDVCNFCQLKGPKGLTNAIYGYEKTFWFCNLAIFNNSAFTAVKRDAKFLTSYVKGLRFFNIRFA